MTRVIEAALADLGWCSLAALDAATRTADSIVRSGGLHRGRQATHMLEAFFARARQEAQGEAQTIPAAYWSVRPAPLGPGGEEQLLLRSAVLVHVRGRRPAEQSLSTNGASGSAGGPTPLSPDLVAALEEPPSRPGRELLRLLRADGLLAPTVLTAALALAAGGVVVEALLFRGLFDLGRELGLAWQRLGAIGAFLIFVVALLLLELPIAAGVLRFGRRLEARLRMAFLEKIPRLGDRYFHSRLTSDMAERSHIVHTLRLLPELGGQFIRLVYEITLTTAGIIWLDPASAPIAVLVAALAVSLPLAVQPLFVELDLRVRNHTGALSRFYLDALLGLVTVRAHGAERAVRREHEGLLVEWARAGLGLQRAVVAVEGVQSFVGLGLAAWLLLDHLAQGGEVGGVLLLVYWALHLPVLGQEVALLARQYPAHRNVTLRLLEPLGAPEESEARESEQIERNSTEQPFVLSLSKHERELSQQLASGVAIIMNGVSVRAAGHTILEEIDLAIEPGSHVAIVGQSGAGKSSLVGVLLGWHRAATGRVLVDGEPVDGRHLERLRRETAWVDPAVQLWNRSLLENLRYGALSELSLPLGRVIEASALRGVLEKLPDGLQTPLGEGGALVSGGEGQRVRLGRSLLRSGVRLVILDEPFRGLDREQRRELLARARQWWSDATLLCITHDVGEVLAFSRVLVVEEGRILEDGVPAALAERPDSRYRAMLEAEEAVREGLWSSAAWRRLWLEGGLLNENGGEGRTMSLNRSPDEAKWNLGKI
ncbi:MAG TPA: ABC transporter ATP-binding protein [Candidatus Binatia bacterium]|jgi:ATP-binding cassette subfamily B protein|nr:ABC transporter ATP-binding protein [Candidatus Binatia bacterium]